MMETELRGNVIPEERKTARNWYFWLWISPLFTVPTFILIALYIGYFDSNELAWFLIVPGAVFGSALWHLILLIPAFDKRSFVGGHGRQALLLSTIRTAIPLFFGLVFRLETGFLISIPLLFVVWFFGTLWGQLEATRGKCTFKRWFGRGEEKIAEREDTKPKEPSAEEWMDILRFSADPHERAQALQALERLGMTEQL